MFRKYTPKTTTPAINPKNPPFKGSRDCAGQQLQPAAQPRPAFVGDEKVPEFVAKAITEQYHQTAKLPCYGANNGECTDYEFCRRHNAPNITLDEVVSFLLKFKPSKEPLNILEIGAGQGIPLVHLKKKHKEKVNLTAISATDYYPNGNAPDAFQYLVMDAHHLRDNSLTRNNKYGLIVSRNTFIHLADSMKALMDAYHCLQDGGFLIIDFVPIPGLSAEQCYILLNHLREMGYKITAFVEDCISQGSDNKPFNTGYGQLSILMIEKTKPTLELPLIYAPANTKPTVCYKLALANLDQHSTHEKNYRMFITYHSAHREYIRTSAILSSKIRMYAAPKYFILTVSEIGKEYFNQDVMEFFNPMVASKQIAKRNDFQKWERQHLPDRSNHNAIENARKKRSQTLLAAAIGFYSEKQFCILARVDKATRDMVKTSKNTKT